MSTYLAEIKQRFERKQAGTVTLLEDLTDDNGALIRTDKSEWTKTKMTDVIAAAEVLLSRFYVHLPTKRTLYAIDPLQALHNLRGEIDAIPDDEPMMGEREFHECMTSIFTSLRDPHTSYYLPDPFRRTMAFLPFLVESGADPDAPEDDDAGAPKRRPPLYFVTKFIGDAFGSGVAVDPQRPIRVTHWNGVRIENLVARMAMFTRGSNPAARLQRAADRLTLRWLGFSVGSDEDWVNLTCLLHDGRRRTFNFEWLAVQRPEGETHAYVTRRGQDPEGEWIDDVRKVLFQSAAQPGRRPKWDVTRKDGSVAFKTLPRDADPKYGYLRLFSFGVTDEQRYVEYVRRLLAEHAELDGLIIDVRGNPGGNIAAAEGLLSLFAPGPVTSQGLQFLNTPEAISLARDVIGPHDGDSIDVRLAEAQATGAAYVASPPITPTRSTASRQTYQGPVVIIVDALTYSAGELFCAGMQDHNLATIIGTTRQTGGGGGNVWSHDKIRIACKDEQIQQKLGLALNVSFDIAVRRTTRVRERTGLALEDMGVVVPKDHMHAITQRDVLGGNEDLLQFAIDKLGTCPNHRIGVAFDGARGFALTVSHVHAKSLDRIDVQDAAGRPLTSARQPFDAPLQMPGADPLPDQLLFRGFLAAGGDAVTTFRWTAPGAPDP